MMALKGGEKNRLYSVAAAVEISCNTTAPFILASSGFALWVSCYSESYKIVPGRIGRRRRADGKDHMGTSTALYHGIYNHRRGQDRCLTVCIVLKSSELTWSWRVVPRKPNADTL